MPASIRWRLPFSYALIALFTALALGLILLSTMYDYYQRKEHLFLLNIAETLRLVLAGPLARGQPPDAIQAQIDLYAFRSQTRIRILDADGNLIADSGIPAPFPPLVQLPQPPELPATPTFPLLPRQPADPNVVTLPAPAADTLFGVALDSGDALPAAPRSAQVVMLSISNSTGELLGYIELSGGPALLQEIVGDALWRWAAASGIAVLLAAAIGWTISRRLSAPLLTLAERTTQMAAGDLAVRAELGRTDEIGLLAVAFDEMAQRVEATVNALRHFLADAAHALHTPLTALCTDLELARDEQPDSPSIRQAQEQVQRLEELIDGLLDLSRIEAAAAGPEFSPLSLNEFVRQVSELHASQADQADLSFSLALPEPAAMVWANRSQLRQALENLLDNALKFTPAGGRICVGVHQQDGQTLLWVEDSGIGIAADDLPHLFDRFYRGRNATGYRGSGLGLAVASAVMAQHGGELQVESEPGRTRFTLALPAAPATGPDRSL